MEREGYKMGKVKLAIATMLKLTFAFCLYGLSLNVAADESPQVEANSSNRHEVTLIRDRDYACTQCHKDEKETLKGSHGEESFAILKRDVNCVECHKSIGPDHREGAPQVIKYSAAQSKVGTEKVTLSFDEILQANSQCTDCHTPDRLREDSWTHDVHAKNLTCSSCHIVHGEKEAVLSFDHSAKIKMCVDCHVDFNQKENKLGE